MTPRRLKDKRSHATFSAGSISILRSRRINFTDDAIIAGNRVRLADCKICGRKMIYMNFSKKINHIDL